MTNNKNPSILLIFLCKYNIVMLIVMVYCIAEKHLFH